MTTGHTGLQGLGTGSNINAKFLISKHVYMSANLLYMYFWKKPIYKQLSNRHLCELTLSLGCMFDLKNKKKSIDLKKEEPDEPVSTTFNWSIELGTAASHFGDKRPFHFNNFKILPLLHLSVNYRHPHLKYWLEAAYKPFAVHYFAGVSPSRDISKGGIRIRQHHLFSAGIGYTSTFFEKLHFLPSFQVGYRFGIERSVVAYENYENLNHINFFDPILNRRRHAAPGIGTAFKIQWDIVPQIFLSMENRYMFFFEKRHGGVFPARHLYQLTLGLGCRFYAGASIR